MMSKFSKKQLVVAGCSMVADYITYRNQLHKENKFYIHPKTINEYDLIEWKQQTPFPTIDILMANHFKLTPVNISSPGAGNQQIFDNVLEYVINNHKKIKLLVVCWTKFNRYDIKTNIYNDHSKYYRTYFYETYNDKVKDEYMYKKFPMLQNLFDLGAIFPENDITIFMKNSFLISNICAQLNIECVQCCSMRTLYFEQNANKILENVFLPFIDIFHFYGWPIFNSLGGKELFIMSKHNTLNEFDTHPNEQGHKMMAEKLIAFIKERNILD